MDTAKSIDRIDLTVKVKMASLRCRGYSMYRPVQRSKFTDEQHDLLTEFFDENQYPNLAAREKIARQTRLDSEQVRIWFQNKRARVRSLSQKDERPARRNSLLKRRAADLSEREVLSSECPSVRDNCCSATTVYDALKECNAILNGKYDNVAYRTFSS